MSVAANVTDQSDPWHPNGYIDSLYDYPAYLKANQGAPIGAAPQRGAPRVAVVGGGLAGLCCAYELARAGYQPVLLEASERLGGRCYSKHLGGTSALAEMGAMRFPHSAGTVFHYFNRFGIDHSQDFPDPGKVYTKLGFENEVYDWPAKQAAPPKPFDKIASDFNKFVGNFVNAVKSGWETAEHDWDKGIQQLTEAWQKQIDAYKDKSFYTAVAEGIDWSSSDLNKFGALGVGSGGFGPLYPVCYLEMLRLFANRLESGQKFVPAGIQSLPEAFLHQPLTVGGSTSLADQGAIYTQTRVDALHPSGDGVAVTYTATAHQRPYTFHVDRVVVTCSTRDMQVMGLSGPADTEPAAFTPRQKDGMRKLHLMNSSKLFIRTKTKFWKEDSSIPQNIQTDAMPHGVYGVDYPGTSDGVVLISYTWGDGSTKLLSLSPQERFKIFKEQIRAIDSKFADCLEPVDGEIACIDWQSEPNYMGAFGLNYPGQDVYTQALYYQFQSAASGADPHIYLAGDAVSWCGGWTESAVHTGINAAAAVVHSTGGDLKAGPRGSPLTQKADRYSYGQ